jgi:hypothetical protein
MEEPQADNDHGDHGQKDVRPERPTVIHGVPADREEYRRQTRERKATHLRDGAARKGGDGHQYGPSPR